MKRIGLFGGSFNPIHLGHTALAAYICEQGLVDEVWLMVSPQNPLKQDLTLLDENERLHMARLAVAPYPMLKACDFEFTLPRPSYTYHTLQALREAYPDCTFSLIIGEDNWDNFHRWYRGEDIARETPIIVYPRDAEGKLRIEGKDSESRTPNSQQPRFVPTSKSQTCLNSFSECSRSSTTKLLIANSQQSPKLLPYSSTEVRYLIAQGEDASHMLHPEVYQYIKAKQLYTK